MLKRFIGNPYLAFLSFLLAVVGIIIAVYFYNLSKEERELKYYLDPVRTIIYRNTQVSDIEIYVNKVKRNIDMTAVQIALWNSGEKSIKSENILENIIIKSEPEVEIVDVLLKKVSRPNIVKMSYLKDDFNDGKIKLNWLIMEKNDGVLLQIIYFGDENVNFLVIGTIEGQGPPHLHKFPSLLGSILPQREQFYSIINSTKSIGILLILMSVGIGIFTVFMHFKFNKREKKAGIELLELMKRNMSDGAFKKIEPSLKDRTPYYSKKVLKFYYTSYVFSFIFLFIGIYILRIVSKYQPPFGF